MGRMMVAMLLGAFVGLDRHRLTRGGARDDPRAEEAHQQTGSHQADHHLGVH
jgi:hypothetical protein